jgi:uncharacterized protein involved in outer membrane biogenesis
MATLFRSLSGLTLIVVLAVIIIIFLGWSRVPDIISGHISKKLKVAVEIGDIDIALRSIEVEKLEIGNPRGYLLPRAFAADTISIRAPLTQYFKDHIEIEEIEVDNIYLGLEFDSPQGAEGNWTTIMQNAKQAQASSPKKGKTLMIRRLILTNIHSNLLYRNQGSKVKRLPVIKRIELKDISSEGGNAIDQLMNSALGEMIKQVFIEQNLKEVLDKIFSPGQNSPLQQGIQQFRGFFGVIDREEANL